jgi:hypothetical protein
VFNLASTGLAFLRRAAIPFGLLYSEAVFAVMNILIVPLTLAPKLTDYSEPAAGAQRAHWNNPLH